MIYALVKRTIENKNLGPDAIISEEKIIQYDVIDTKLRIMADILNENENNELFYIKKIGE